MKTDAPHLQAPTEGSRPPNAVDCVGPEPRRIAVARKRGPLRLRTPSVDPVWRLSAPLPGGPGRFRAGFTLLELAVVLAITVVVAAIAIPRYSAAIANYRAKAAAYRIASDMAMARNKARAGSATQSVVFTVASNEYSIPGLPHLDRTGQEYEVSLADEPYRAELVSASFGGSSQATFNGYGIPASGGSVTVRVGSVQRTVVLDADTGEARVQ